MAIVERLARVDAHADGATPDPRRRRRSRFLAQGSPAARIVGSDSSPVPELTRNAFDRALCATWQSMEKALWYLFAGTRGGANRVRIVRELAARPRNANELAERLDLDYNTVTHHLDMLTEHDVIEAGGSDYGQLYFLTDRFERHEEVFEEIATEVD